MEDLDGLISECWPFLVRITDLKITNGLAVYEIKVQKKR